MFQTLRSDIQDCINSNLNCSFNYEHSRPYLLRVVKPISVNNNHLNCTEDGVFKVFKLDGIYEFQPALEFGRLNNCNKLYYHSTDKTTIFKYDSLTDLAMKMTNYFGRVYTTIDLFYFTSNHFTYIEHMRVEGLSRRNIFESILGDRCEDSYLEDMRRLEGLSRHKFFESMLGDRCCDDDDEEEDY